MLNTPTEIFAKVCTFLSPDDLFALSQVCRKFRGYLCAPNSFSTQKIWKESRLKFMPREDMPPPEGMSEEKYVELLMTERGCQICKRISKECKIYWEFEVRCCEKCFLKKTSSLFALIAEKKYPYKFLSIIPCVRVHKLHYWKEQIGFVYSQYHGLSGENLQSWLDDKKYMLDSLMEYVEQRKSKEAKFRHVIYDFEEEHSNILKLFSGIPQLLLSDRPSYRLRLQPRKRIHRNNNDNNEEVNNDFKDIPPYIQSEIQDILIGREKWWEKRREMMKKRKRERREKMREMGTLSELYYSFYLYSDIVESIIEEILWGWGKEKKWESKEGKKREREGEKKERNNFIKSEKKKHKGKFYKFNVKRKKFQK